MLISFYIDLRATPNNTIWSPWIAIGQVSQLVDGKLPDLPHGHDNVIVTLQSLANLHTHPGVQA